MRLAYEYLDLLEDPAHDEEVREILRELDTDFLGEKNLLGRLGGG